MQATATGSGPPTAAAYSYLRFSSPEQMKGDSLRRQTEASERYAEENGLIIDRDLKLQDLGVSAFRGKNATEGALCGFMEAVRTGRVPSGSTLLVESLDRLSRTEITVALTQFLNIINAGITVVTLMDHMAYNREGINQNPGNLMMSIVIMTRAHEESATKSKRLSQAWANRRKLARETGRPMGRNCPPWLRWTPGGYELRPERAAIVRLIFRLAAEGMGKRSITQTLNKERIPTWGGKGDGWYDSGVWKLLADPAVLGTYRPRRLDPGTGKYVPEGDPVENYYPAAITPAEWAAAKSRPSAPRGPRRLLVGNLFSGIVYCGYTGHKMRFMHRSGSRYLRSDVERFAPAASPQSWPYAHFERTVLNHLRELDWQSLIKPHGDPEKDRLLAEAARLDLEAARHREGVARILDSFATDAQPAALVKAARERAARLSRELETAEARLAEIRGALAAGAKTTAAIASGIEEFKALIPAGNPQERLRLQTEIRRRVKRIHCYRHGVPNEQGIILCSAPALEIEYPNGMSRWVLVGADNPLRKRRKSTALPDPRNP